MEQKETTSGMTKFLDGLAYGTLGLALVLFGGAGYSYLTSGKEIIRLLFLAGGGLSIVTCNCAVLASLSHSNRHHQKYYGVDRYDFLKLAIRHKLSERSSERNNTSTKNQVNRLAQKEAKLNEAAQSVQDMHQMMGILFDIMCKSRGEVRLAAKVLSHFAGRSISAHAHKEVDQARFMAHKKFIENEFRQEMEDKAYLEKFKRFVQNHPNR